jgi:hypothetical protein
MWDEIKSWVHALLSEDNGTPSSSRVLMFLFSLFSITVVWECFHHIFGLKDTTQIGLWLAAIPPIIKALVGLVSLPYGINKSHSAFTTIVKYIAEFKKYNHKDIAKLDESLEESNDDKVS